MSPLCLKTFFVLIEDRQRRPCALELEERRPLFKKAVRSTRIIVQISPVSWLMGDFGVSGMDEI
jgi:hypothetical protein